MKKKESEVQEHCVIVEEKEDDSDCTIVKKEINGIPVVYLATEEGLVEEKRGRTLAEHDNKENKKPSTKEPRRTPSWTRTTTTTLPSPSKPSKEKLWSTLRETVNLYELSKRTLDAPVLGVTVQELLSISQDLMQ